MKLPRIETATKQQIFSLQSTNCTIINEELKNCFEHFKILANTKEPVRGVQGALGQTVDDHRFKRTAGGQ
jgi:hypothetical protein